MSPSSPVQPTQEPASQEARLHLRIVQDLGDTQASLPATIRVHTGKTLWKQTVMIPVGPAGQSAARSIVTVPPGPFSVEAISPSGAAYVAQGEAMSGDDKTVSIEAESASPKGLGWASYATDQKFASRPATLESLPPRRSPKRASASRSGGSSSWLERNQLGFTSPAAQIGPALEALVRKGTMMRRSHLPEPLISEITQGLESDGEHQPSLREAMGPTGRVRLWRRAGSTWTPCSALLDVQNTERNVVMIRMPTLGEPSDTMLAEVRGEHTRLSEWCVVPACWPLQDTGRWAPVSIIVDIPPGPAAASGPQLRVRTSVMDSDFALLAGFLRQGDTESLKAVNEQMAPRAESILAAKRSNPLLAAAAGLALLRTRQLHLLHDWTRNLATWFPGIPDGAVIRAWHLLYSRGSDPAAAARAARFAASNSPEEDPKEYLLQAANRGVPAFAESLRLLMNGLRLFKECDPRVPPALEKIQRYCWAADANEEFTSYRGSAPDAPGHAASSHPIKDRYWSATWQNPLF